jgi:CRP-like cAMP-binding protein
MPPPNTERFMRFLLKNTPLTSAESADLITRFEAVNLKENDYFLKVGMPVNKIGFLAGGILRRYTIDEKGNELIRQFITEDHFFTDLDGFFREKPSGDNIQSVTPCCLFILSINELVTLQEEHPRLKPIINQISIQNLYERVKTDDFLRPGTSIEKYNRFITHFPHLAQRLSLKHIASYLHITQQSLSRIRRQMIESMD